MTRFIFTTFMAAAAAAASLPAYAQENGGYYSRIIRLQDADPDAEVSEIESQGGIVLHRRGDLALALLPESPGSGTDGEVALRKSARRGGGDRSIGPRPTMDLALPLSGIDRILDGQAPLPSPYDGTGVVVGFCDLGIDTRHINFTAPDGTARIAKVVRYAESEGRVDVYDTPEEIYAFHTDNPDEYHATHVAGILAGSHEVTSMPGITEGGRLRGVASGAEIVATVSELTEVGLLAGVEEIIAYARERGKPAVVNISVGNNTGPHDGTSLFCQYLDLCAREAVICISAGNEGSHTNHQPVEKASEADPLRVRIAGADWVNFELYGQTDIYSADGTPFDLVLQIADSPLDGTEGSIVYRSAPMDFTETPLVILSSTEDALYPEEVYDAGFARYFDGKVYMEGGIDPENGRHYATVIYDCATDEQYSEEKRWARYRLELLAVPAAPVRLDAFADGHHSWLAAIGSYPHRPGSTLSISDLATGHDTISVGMYCTRADAPLINGDIFPGEGDFPYVISEWSSYGVLPDGRVTPSTNGPGRPIISSMSGAYVEAHGEEYCTLAVEAAGERHYWGPQSGTSMSSPLVAGTIATWLEAVPTLTPADVREIISGTNYYPQLPDGSDTATNPRYGMGCFDGYAGLLKALGKSGATAILPDSNVRLRAVAGREGITVFNTSGIPATAEIYTLQGTLAATIPLGADPVVTFDAALTVGAGGACIVRISGETLTPVTLKVIAANLR